MAILCPRCSRTSPGLPGLGLAAFFLAVQWFLPMASAQSDDSGQFHRQGRAPSSRQIRYHGDRSQLQLGTGRRIPAFSGSGSCSIPPTQPTQI